MSNNKNDGRNGFKNSRIDLSQLGDDTWNKPMSRKPATPGPRRRPVAAAPIASGRRTHLDELFESRVKAAAARRTVKQSRGQNRIWMFAGGLFLASVGGVAAAYYLVGPPMATTAYKPVGSDVQVAQTSSLEVDGHIAGTSSHFQGVPISAAATGTLNDDVDGPQETVMAQPPADDQSVADTLGQDSVARHTSVQVEAGAATVMASEAVQSEQEEVAVGEPPVAEPPQPAAPPPDKDRVVHIVPTSVSDDGKTKTNVNVPEAADVSGAAAGQWVALPPEEKQKPTTPSIVTAAATQQPDETKPVAGPVKTQQELYEAFQAYLKSSGRIATGDEQDQEALFNKFMRWSEEALKGN